MALNQFSRSSRPTSAGRPGDVISVEVPTQSLAGVMPGTRVYYRINDVGLNSSTNGLITLDSQPTNMAGSSLDQFQGALGSFIVDAKQNTLRLLAKDLQVASSGNTHLLQLYFDRFCTLPLGVEPIAIQIGQAVPTDSTPIQEQIKANEPLRLQPLAESGAPEEGHLLEIDANTMLVVGARRAELESLAGSAAEPTLFTQILKGNGDTTQKANWVVGERQAFTTLKDPNVDFGVDELRNSEGGRRWLVSLPRTAYPNTATTPIQVADPGTLTAVGRAVIDLYRIEPSSPQPKAVQTVDLGLAAGSEIERYDSVASGAGLLAVLKVRSPNGSAQWWLAELDESQPKAVSLQAFQPNHATVLDRVTLHNGDAGQIYVIWSERGTTGSSVFVGQLQSSSVQLLWSRQLATGGSDQKLNGADLLVTGSGTGQRLLAAVTLASGESLIGSQLVLSVLDSQGQLLNQRNLLDAPEAQASTNILSHPDLVQIPDGRVALTATAYDAANSILPNEVYGLMRADGSDINGLDLYEAVDKVPGVGDYHEQFVPLSNKGNTVAVLSESYDQTKPNIINGLTFDVLSLDQIFADLNQYFIPYRPNQPAQNSLDLSSSDTAATALSTDSTGQPWLTSFAVVGDFGNVFWKKNNLSTEKAPVNYVGQAIRRLQPDFIVSLGDDNYVEGTREWKDFNVGKNFAPYIYPYTVSKVNKDDADAKAFASPNYLNEQVPRTTWNRFYPLPGNHDVGMGNNPLDPNANAGFMEASGRRDWSYDNYYKAALEHSAAKGSVIPIAGSYVKKGDILYWDYSYDTGWNPATWGKYKEGAMDRSYYDYIAHPVNKNGAVLDKLANIYMVDRNNSAYGTDTYAYKQWKKKNPSSTIDPQAQALMEEGKKRRNDVPWQIFASHYETFTSERVNKNSADGLMPGMHLPYFSSGFDLVLGAHVHNYERFKNKDSSGKEGTYIVNGTGGYNTVYTAFAAGKGEVFAPIGKATGYQAGWTGGFGFGWIDMNADELKYTQKYAFFEWGNTQFDIGFARDYVEGKTPLDQVVISDIDSFILRKKSGGALLTSGLKATSRNNGMSMDPTQLNADDVERIDIITNARLDRGDIYLETYANDTTTSTPKGAVVRIEADNPRNGIHLSGYGDVVEARNAGLIIDGPRSSVDYTGGDVITLSAGLRNSTLGADAITIDQSAPLMVMQQGSTLVGSSIAALAGGLGATTLHNVVQAGGGDNTITASALNDFIISGGGKDVITAVGGVDLIAPGAGADTINTSGAQVTLRLAASDLDGSTKTINGWDSNDRLALTDEIRISGYGTNRLTLRSDRRREVATVLQLNQGTWSKQQVINTTTNQLWRVPDQAGERFWISADNATRLRLDHNQLKATQLSFVRLQDASGQVKDPVSGQLLKPSDAGYVAAALQPANQLGIQQLPSLSGESWLAPVITRADGNRIWSIASLNNNGESLFKILGPNQFGVELGDSSHSDFSELIATVIS